MSAQWRFSVHRSSNFQKLIDKLQDLGIVTVEPDGSNANQIRILQPSVLGEAFRTIFILYATPNESHICFSKNDRRLVTSGKYINLSLTESVSENSNELLDVLITGEGDKVIEAGFNALLAVYLGSICPLDFIYPNTYIADLGRHTHEFDIFLGTQDKSCMIVETTRGFDKEIDAIEETYLWHFKKALFRKWTIEKLYGIDCRLCYITLKNLLKEPIVVDELPTELSNEARLITNTSNPLIEEIRQQEGDQLHILEVEDLFTGALIIREIDIRLEDEFVKRLTNVFPSSK